MSEVGAADRAHQRLQAILKAVGRHPKDLGELRRLAAVQEPDLLRWIPAGTKEAA